MPVFKGEMSFPRAASSVYFRELSWEKNDSDSFALTQALFSRTRAAFLRTVFIAFQYSQSAFAKIFCLVN